VFIEVLDQRLTVVVTNPMGAGPAAEAPPGGFGLVGLHERVTSVRGTLSSGVAPGGFRLAATLPLRTQEDT
jgi:signal transduction histidine kinase